MLKNEIDDFESQGKQNEKTLCSGEEYFLQICFVKVFFYFRSYH